MTTKIFIDLDETLWHSEPPERLFKAFLVPADVLSKMDYSERRKAAQEINARIEDRTNELLKKIGVQPGMLRNDSDYNEADEKANIEFCLNAGWNLFRFGEYETYVTKLRPHTMGFLEAVSTLGELHICTNSLLDYATEISETLGIRKFFKTLSTREDLESGLHFQDLGTDWLLVDDQPPTSEMIIRKMRFLTGDYDFGETLEHLVPVPEWFGDPTDQVFPPLVARIENCIKTMKSK
jgi:phosphoglycolate phosphatase-like HAD superfamily hydrolase